MVVLEQRLFDRVRDLERLHILPTTSGNTKPTNHGQYHYQQNHILLNVARAQFRIGGFMVSVDGFNLTLLRG
tara:strand:+ start:5148 stop:5363 length:216 start_codon:yes stop_codon:yes gene_type:complete